MSSIQLDDENRGFSFLKEGPLDMRMNQSSSLSAKEIVNKWSKKDLGNLFRNFGAKEGWKNAVDNIVEARKKKPIETTKDLSDIISKSSRRRKRSFHPATLIFQAIRICVNMELKSVQEGLKKALGHLSEHGKIAVISFHSLEDRIVKHMFKTASLPVKRLVGDKEKTFLPILKLLTSKPITPKKEEIESNPRSRSACLRAAVRI